MSQTVVEKIVGRHRVDGPKGPDRPLIAGDYVTLRPRHVLTHDNTAAAMEKFARLGCERIADPRQPVIVLDHDIQNRSRRNRERYRSIEAFAEQHCLDFYRAGTGIGHQIMVEQLYVTPGSFVVASDSHANMYGALGAIGTPVVRTDAAVIWANGSTWWQIPPTVQVRLEGSLPRGATGKDVILTLIGLYPNGEVLNAAVEFDGPGIGSLSVESRMAIANMTTEWGALTGWFPVDERTLEYLDARRALGRANGIERVDDATRRAWEDAPPAPDPGASYSARITLDLAAVTPRVAGPDSVQQVQPVDALAARRIEVDRAYIVSCVNSRGEDLAAAAYVLRGSKVADGVSLYVAAASHDVEQAARERGDWQALLDAGAEPLPSGCGPCIGLGTGVLAAGEVGISATNRNFRGRMGSPEAHCYLASPAVVAASARAGYICAPDRSSSIPLERRFERFDCPQAATDDAIELVPGFPETVEGRWVLLPKDHLDTDQIIDKQATFRDDPTAEAMARAAFLNYDAELAGRLRAGDVIVGGRDFGTGSSREQAVTALQAIGVALVVAESFSRTYLRNAFNNGFVCLACPTLVTWLRRRWTSRIASGERVIFGDESLTTDFRTRTMRIGQNRFEFPLPGPVLQRLVACGGVENQLRQARG